MILFNIETERQYIPFSNKGEEDHEQTRAIIEYIKDSY